MARRGDQGARAGDDMARQLSALFDDVSGPEDIALPTCSMNSAPFPNSMNIRPQSVENHHLAELLTDNQPLGEQSLPSILQALMKQSVAFGGELHE